MAIRIAVALLLALPAVATAQPQTMVQACVRQGTGKVRLVSPGTACKPKETAITWPTQAADLSAFFTKAESDARYLAAGGTAVAAQSAATCDAADTATTCTTAASAATCQSAGTAQTAATCDYATAAGTATSCQDAATCAACTSADSATTALDAQRVGGVTVQPFAWRAAIDAEPATVLSLGGLTLQAACVYYTPDPEALPPWFTIALTPATAVDDAVLHVLVDAQAPTIDYDFDVADPAAPLRSGLSASQARLAYATPDGGVVQVDWMSAVLAFGTTDCILRGVARYVPPPG